MFVIGITGGIGTGKSTVARICAQTGYPVLDADQISRAVTASGGRALSEIAEKFGTGILAEDGSLDRQKTAALVFKDRRSLDRLSQIIHRHVLAEIAEGIDRHREKGIKAIFLDVPIPVRQGFLDKCDQVWVVWADESVRIRRLAERGMTEEEARRRIAMQMTDEEYRKLGHHLIENNGDYASLVSSVRTLVSEELGQRGIRFKPIEEA